MDATWIHADGHINTEKRTRKLSASKIRSSIAIRKGAIRLAGLHQRVLHQTNLAKPVSNLLEPDAYS